MLRKLIAKIIKNNLLLKFNNKKVKKYFKINSSI